MGTNEQLGTKIQKSIVAH